MKLGCAYSAKGGQCLSLEGKGDKVILKTSLSWALQETFQIQEWRLAGGTELVGPQVRIIIYQWMIDEEVETRVKKSGIINSFFELSIEELTGLSEFSWHEKK